LTKKGVKRVAGISGYAGNQGILGIFLKNKEEPF
jgi:hypothetical protein